jgi:hypothetical protein
MGQKRFFSLKKKSNFDEAMQLFVEMLLYTGGLCVQISR